MLLQYLVDLHTLGVDIRFGEIALCLAGFLQSRLGCPLDEVGFSRRCCAPPRWAAGRFSHPSPLVFHHLRVYWLSW